MRNIKLGSVLLLALAITLMTGAPALAINLFGYMAPGSYAACRQADRYSAISFCEGVEWALNTDMRNATGVWYEDQNAFESRYLSNVNTVDMFVYSGTRLKQVRTRARNRT